MALIDPADRTAQFKPSDPETTKHPGICLIGMFGFMIGSALLAHVAINALL